MSVLGQSEGAIIALMLAAQDPGISFLIWQGGVYNNLEGIIQWQARAFWELNGGAISTMKQNVPLIYWICRQFDDLIASAHRGDRFYHLGDEEWSFNLYLPGIKEHFDNPPSNFVDKVKCPVLIMHGKLDHNTPYKEAEQAYEALIRAGNANVAIHIFEGSITVLEDLGMWMRTL